MKVISKIIFSHGQYDLYVGNLKESVKKLLELIIKLGKVSRYKVNIQESIVILYIGNLKKLIKYIVYCGIKKNKRGKNLTKNSKSYILKTIKHY